MLGLQYAGSTWLHETNENGVCKHCGRLREELKAGYYFCHRDDSFKPNEYVKAPRHPLFWDCINEIRNCGYCQNTRSGFCKRHNDLRQFLESDSRYEKRIESQSQIKSNGSGNE